MDVCPFAMHISFQHSAFWFKHLGRQHGSLHTIVCSCRCRCCLCCHCRWCNLFFVLKKTKWNKLNGTKRLESFATFNAHKAYIFKVERKTGETLFFFIMKTGKKILSCRHTDSSSLILRFLSCCQTNHWNSLHFLFSLSKAKIDIIWCVFVCTECMAYEEWSRLMFQFLLAKISQFTMLCNPYIWMYFCQIFGFELKKNGFFAYGTFGT